MKSLLMFLSPEMNSMENHQMNTTKTPVEVWSMNMQPEEQMQLWLLSLLFDQTVTTEKYPQPRRL